MIMCCCVLQIDAVSLSERRDVIDQRPQDYYNNWPVNQRPSMYYNNRPVYTIYRRGPVYTIYRRAHFNSRPTYANWNWYRPYYVIYKRPVNYQRSFNDLLGK